MLSAISRNAAWNDLAVLGDERLHHADVFVVHDVILIRAKAADLLASEAAAAASAIITVFVHATIAAIFAGWAFTFVTFDKSSHCKILR
jgi:hypothetical protein